MPWGGVVLIDTVITYSDSDDGYWYLLTADGVSQILWHDHDVQYGAFIAMCWSVASPDLALQMIKVFR
ncbi:hypothetical protein GCM10010399_65680 [Dactylosporangium fulvum]